MSQRMGKKMFQSTIKPTNARVKKIMLNGQHYKCGAYAGANLGVYGCTNDGVNCSNTNSSNSCSNCCSGSYTTIYNSNGGYYYVCGKLNY